MSLTLAANDRTITQLTHQLIYYGMITNIAHMSMNSYDQRFNINKHINKTP